MSAYPAQQPSAVEAASPEQASVRRRGKSGPPDRLLLDKADRYAQQITQFRNVLMVRHARNDHYVNGNQYIEYDPITNQFFELESGSEFAQTNNQLVTFVRARAAMLTKGRGKYEVEPDTIDRKNKQATRYAQAFVENELEGVGEDDRYMECLRSAVHGRSYRRSYVSLTGPPVKQPVFGRQKIAIGPATFQCPDCGQGGAYDENAVSGSPGGAAPDADAPPLQSSEGPGGDGGGYGPDQMDHTARFATCPACGSPNAQVTRPQSADISAITGHKEVPGVVLGTLFFSDYHAWWDPDAGTPWRSPWFEQRSLCVREQVEALYPDANTAGASPSGDDLGMEYQRTLGRAAGNFDSDPWRVQLEGQVGGPTDLRCEVREIWLERFLYDADTPTVDRKYPSSMVRAGVPLGQQFPSGCRLVVVGGHVCDMVNEAKNDVIVDFADGLRPNEGYARGIEDWIYLQNRINNLGNFEEAWLAMLATGNYVVNPDMITSPDMRNNLGSPGKVVEADGLMAGEDLNRAVIRIGGEPLSPAVPNLKEQAKGDMQTMAATYATASGVPNAPIDTATGVNAMMDQIQQLQAPVLSLRSWSEARWLKQRLVLAQRYFFDSHALRMRGAAGNLATKQFTRVDIAGEFTVKPIAESYLTRTQMQMRNDVVGALNLGYGNPQTPPEIADLIRKTFVLDETDDARAAWENVAERRINAVIENAEKLIPQFRAAAQSMQMRAMTEMQAGRVPIGPDGNPVDPAAGLMQSAIAALIAPAAPDPLDADPIFIKSYTDWRISDEGLDADPLLRQAFLTLVQAHEQAQVMKVQRETMKQMMATAPARAAEAIDSDRDREADETAKDRQHQRDLERQREA